MKKYFFAIFILILTHQLSGQIFQNYAFETGMMYLNNSSDEGAPSPILPYFGVSGSIDMGNNRKLTPSVLFTGNYYLWSDAEEKAIPAEIEYADSVWFLSMLVDVPYTFRYQIKEKLFVSWLVSPVLALKIPLKTWGDGENQRGDMLGWFYKGRFIYLEAGSGLEWHYSETKSYGLELCVLYPVYHIWEGSDFLDSMIVRLGFIFSFNKKDPDSTRNP